jgi:hypothetical protein
MTGTYYTPKEIEKIVNPSTGTSAFLIDAADMLSNPPYTAQHSLHPTQSLLARLWAMVIRALRG